MKILNSLLQILILITLTACGNRFAITEDIAAKLADINMNVSEESIEAYEFTSHLRNILNTKSGSSKYKLDISFTKSSQGLVIQRDSDSLRESKEVVVTYKLFEKGKDKPIYSGKFRQISSYNAMFSPYSSNVEAMQTNANLFKTSAEELRRRLILYFKRESLK